MREIAPATRGKIVDDQDLVAQVEQDVDKMTADEPRATGHDDRAVFEQHG
jgi:hypothetical protein